MGNCKRQLSNGSRSFYFASHLLPSVMQQAACGLYAFVEADDLIDEGSDPQAALNELHGRLDRIYEGNPLYLSTDRVLTQIVHSYQLPRALLDALLEGFEWDSQGRSYQTIEEVYDYSASSCRSRRRHDVGAYGCQRCTYPCARSRSGHCNAADQYCSRCWRGRSAWAASICCSMNSGLMVLSPRPF